MRKSRFLLPPSFPSLSLNNRSSSRSPDAIASAKVVFCVVGPVSSTSCCTRVTDVFFLFFSASSLVFFSIRYDTRATVDERKVFTSTMAWDFYERDSTTSPLSNFDATKDSW